MDWFNQQNGYASGTEDVSADSVATQDAGGWGDTTQGVADGVAVTEAQDAGTDVEVDAGTDGGDAAEDGRTEAAADGSVGTDDKDDAKSARRKRKAVDPRKAEVEQVRRIVGAYEAMADPRALAAAKVIAQVGKDDRATLVAELKDRKTRARLDRMRELVDLLSQGDDLNLMFKLMEDRQQSVKPFMQLLSALQPEAGIGRPSDNLPKDVKGIMAKWDPSVDVSFLGSLAV